MDGEGWLPQSEPLQREKSFATLADSARPGASTCTVLVVRMLAEHYLHPKVHYLGSRTLRVYSAPRILELISLSSSVGEGTTEEEMTNEGKNRSNGFVGWRSLCAGGDSGHQRRS